MISRSELLLEYGYIKKAFTLHGEGLKYLYARFLVAKKARNYRPLGSKASEYSELSIHLLSCHRHMPMMILSLQSFYKACDFDATVFIHNDGSLTEKDQRVLSSCFPFAVVVKPEAVMKNLDSKLEGFPVVKTYYQKYTNSGFVLLKKLLEPYLLCDKKYCLIIDSDLLWFKKPEELTEELSRGCQKSLLAINNQPRYVYFNDGGRLDDSLARFNSGVVLFHRNNFNLERLTAFFDKLDLSDSSSSHLIEQAGYASCLDNPQELTYQKYTIDHDIEDHTVVKHYTGKRRELFYIEGAKYFPS